ncbi:MAG TPA: hypothetical protein VGA31_10590 [Thermoanaerobaculia bacterium]
MKKSGRAAVLAVAALSFAIAAESSRPARPKTLEVTYYYLPG